MNQERRAAARLQVKAYCIALAVHAVLYFGSIIYTHYRPLTTGQDLAILLWYLDAFFAPMITGLVAAQVAGARRIMMGASAGLLAGFMAIISNLFTLGPGPALHNAPWLLIYYIVMGGFGGLLSWLLARILKRTANG